MFHVKHSITHNRISDSQLQELNTILDENRDQLYKYAELLLWWNGKVNLVSRDVSHETIKEHIRHSLLLYSILKESGVQRIVDSGTGGGLPGIPLAICLPEKNFILNDVVTKKLLAVKQMVKGLEITNVQTDTRSIKEVPLDGNELIVSKHAFKIDELVNLLEKSKWKKLVLLKGESEAENELSGLKKPVSLSITNLDSVIKSEFYKGKAIVEVYNNYE